MGALGMKMDDVEGFARDDLAEPESGGKVEFISDDQGPPLYPQRANARPQISFGMSHQDALVSPLGKVG
jgi:hypothetical protein